MGCERTISYAKTGEPGRMGSVGGNPLLRQRPKSAKAICRARNNLVTRRGETASFKSFRACAGPVQAKRDYEQTIQWNERVEWPSRTRGKPHGQSDSGDTWAAKDRT